MGGEGAHCRQQQTLHPSPRRWCCSRRPSCGTWRSTGWAQPRNLRVAAAGGRCSPSRNGKSTTPINLSRWHTQQATEEAAAEAAHPRALTQYEKDDLAAELEFQNHMKKWEARQSSAKMQLAACRQHEFVQVDVMSDLVTKDAWVRVESIDQLMEQLFGWLAQKDIGRSAQVCKRWRDAAAFERTWELLARRAYPTLVLLKEGCPLGRIVENDHEGSRARSAPPHLVANPKADRLPYRS